ncbi:hypothetical protein Tco_0277466, partial [Tanacetum coccineum]
MNDYAMQQGDNHSPLPQALANIVGTTHTLDFKSHTYYEHNTYESFTCWRIVTAEGMDESGGSSIAGGSRASETPEFKRLLRHPSVTTPSKVNEAKKQKRGEAAESDDEASFVADTHQGWESSGYKKTQKVTNNAENQSLASILQHSIRIESNTVIRQDGRVQSYCGLQLKGIGPSILSTSRIPSHNRTNVYQQAIASTSNYLFSDAHRRKTEGGNKCKSTNVTKGVAFTSRGTEISYHNIGSSSLPYCPCNANLCFGMKRGVYTFRVNGQSYHTIGSLIPEEGTQPRQYNKPTVVEVAALITNDFGDRIPSRDIIVNKLHSGPKRISELHPAYMAIVPVRIYQKSHENNQKRASTDTGLRRVQKEAKESKPKPEKSSL